MNFKRLILSIVAVLLLYAGNIIYYQLQQIDGPFFLNHYYDIEVNRDGVARLELYYVTNKQQEVWHLAIPESEYTTIVYDNVHQQFPHYQVKRASVELHLGHFTEEFTTITVDAQFSNDDYKQYAIGEIILRPSSYVEGEPYLPHLASGGSSDYTGFSLFEIPERMQLVQIDSPFLPRLKDELQIFLDYDGALAFVKEKIMSGNDEEMETLVRDEMWRQGGVELDKVSMPITFEKKATVKVNSRHQFNEESSHRSVIFQFPIMLMFETDSGKTVVGNHYINYHPYFSNREIKALAKRVGEQHE